MLFQMFKFINNMVNKKVVMGLPAHEAVFIFFIDKTQIFKVNSPMFNLLSSKLWSLHILEEILNL